MAINANTVYTTVLSILNKEQRGYLTPDEFNKVATQVQLEIFEKFFEDYNQYLRMPKTDVDYASRMDHIYEEFQLFIESNSASVVNGNIYNQPVEGTPTNANDVHRLGSINYNLGKGAPQIELVGISEYTQQTLSPLTLPTSNFPIGIYTNNKITVYPASTGTPAVTDVTFNYIRKPKDIRWGYYVGSLGQYLYDPTVYGANLLNNKGVLSTITTNPTGITTNKTYPGLTTTVSPTGGSGAILSAVVSGGTVTSVSVTTPGSGYSVDDVLTVSQAQLAGGSSNLDITLTASDFNSGSTFGSTNFEISDSQQTEVILEILKYSGVIIRDPQIIQAASQELAQEEVNTKR